MLSWDDALDFSTQKRSFLWAFFSILFLIFLSVLIGILLHQRYSLFSAVSSSDPSILYNTVSIGILGRLFASIYNISFWKILYPIALTLIALSLATFFVFFAQELILAKKKLFNLPSRFSFSFFVRTLLKILVLFLPLAVLLYFYAHDVIHSIVSFGIKTAMRTQPVYQYPFSKNITIGIISFAIFYLYYTIALFLENFSFKPLLKASCFFKHIKTVFELLIYHFLTFLLFFGAWNILLIVDKNLTSRHVCAPFLTIYFLVIAFSKKIRFPLMLPIFLYLIVFLGCYWTFGWPLLKIIGIPLLVGILTLNLFFVCTFIFLSTIAHLFAQTTYVFRFDITPSMYEKSTQYRKKLQSIEDTYEEYLSEHKKELENNYFNKNKDFK